MKTAPKYALFVIIFTGLLFAGRFYFKKNQKLGTSTNSTTVQNSSVKSPSPTATPTLSTKEHYNWKKYKNDKIGVSFEYPDYFEIKEQEFDNRGKYEDNLYSEYSFDVDFSSEYSRNLKSYPIDEVYFSLVMQPNPGYFDQKYKKFKPSSTKKIGLYEWSRYPEIDCEKMPKDGVICTDIGGGAFLSYHTHIGGYEYSFSINSYVAGISENSPDFIRMLETTVISPPQLDAP